MIQKLNSTPIVEEEDPEDIPNNSEADTNIELTSEEN
jgi:hypothetical protein